MKSTARRLFTLVGTAVLALILTGPAPLSAQDLYVSLYVGESIQKITPGGAVAQFASLSMYTQGIAFDAAGNLFAATNQGVIYKYTPDGQVSTFANSGGQYLAFDAAGNLYATLGGSNTVLKYTPDGKSSVFANTGLNYPTGLAFDAAGNLFVANGYGGNIERFTPGGTGTQFAQNLSYPTGLAFDAAGNLFVSCLNNNTVMKFAPDGTSTAVPIQGLDGPYCLTFDATGNLYVANQYGNGNILKYTQNGATSVFASFKGGTPFGLAFAPFISPSFFNGQVSVGNGVDYLGFPNGNYFGYYAYLSDPHYIYHFDLGYEYVFDAADGKSGVYFYDFASQTFFYTSPSFPFPYLYDFTLNAVLYYYPDPSNPGRYNTKGVRYFYNFSTGKIITK